MTAVVQSNGYTVAPAATIVAGTRRQAGAGLPPAATWPPGWTPGIGTASVVWVDLYYRPT